MESQIAQLYNPLLHFVKNRINNKHDAEDLTQDVFFKLAKSNIEEVESLKSWVYSIARNTITDYYRKRKVHIDEISDMHSIPDDENPDARSQELSKCVAAYVNQLPVEYHEIMRLSELEGVPQKEIAERLGMNYVTVRSKKNTTWESAFNRMLHCDTRWARKYYRLQGELYKRLLLKRSEDSVSAANASTKTTSGCTPSACRGAKTKFGEAKVITALRENLIALKADMETSTEPKFERRAYDIHGIVGETDDESLEIIIKEIQVVETAFAQTLEVDAEPLELPENKAKQVLYLNERISALHAML